LSFLETRGERFMRLETVTVGALDPGGVTS
jgi:hypothetical protein